MTATPFQLESLNYQTDADLHQSIRALMLSARVHVQQAVNTSMLQTDQQIAKLIEEEEQGGQQRAAKTKQVIPGIAKRLKGADPDSQAFFCNPFVAEFLGAPAVPALYEKDLKSGLLYLLQIYFLGLNKGFALVARQKQLSVKGKDCFVDFVFYNYLLKCFVLVDLKVNQLGPRDARRMDEYVRAFDEEQSQQVDIPTLGLTLYSEHDAALAMYSSLSDKDQLFVRKYKALLPTEAELQDELARNQSLLEKHPQT